jgi:hypothetical protein
VSGIPYRAFFSEQVSAGTAAAGIYIVDAEHDRRAAVAPIGAGITPGKMMVTPNRALTLVFSGYLGAGSDNQFSVISNAKEAAAGTLALPGFTDSFVVTPDSNTAYVAVPTATVVGQSPGVVKVISLASPVFTGQVDIPSVRYLSISNSGSRVLGFSDVLTSLASPCDQTPSYVFVINPSDVGVKPCPATPVYPNAIYPFDHPVTAFFSSDDSTAYVVNCGAECGGSIASVQPIDMSTTTATAGTAYPVPAATVGLMNGSTLYLAGTPVPAVPCTGQTTQAASCGLLTIFDLTSMTITNTSPIPITDGTHSRIALAANGRLYLGAHNCTELTGSEVRGCLSIYNLQTGAVVVPPAGGDVTGIQPIAKRTVVYVVQNGELGIYDTATDALAPNPNSPNNPGRIMNLVGDFYDVKTIDF